MTVVKLVAADTIEERVLDLHSHKRTLADGVLADQATPMTLDSARLEALLC
ncbi:MAG: hypothetical protein OXU20_00035 [Myxococcales bacterium]|nr:hypothetical protein [Myxococcales bacterium]